MFLLATTSWRIKIYIIVNYVTWAAHTKIYTA